MNNSEPKSQRSGDKHETLKPELPAGDPQFPYLIETPDLQMSSRRAVRREPCSAIIVKLDKLLTRICLSIEMPSGDSRTPDAGEEQIRLEMSPGTAEALGTQLLYACDKLTTRT